MKRMPTAREQHFRTKHHRADAPDILEEKKISTDKKELRNKNQSESPGGGGYSHIWAI